MGPEQSRTRMTNPPNPCGLSHSRQALRPASVVCRLSSGAYNCVHSFYAQKGR
ncbi:hypothetical protein RSAG8_00161, partial [Rhizoctonia solani AG-8 WAC10335]